MNKIKIREFQKKGFNDLCVICDQARKQELKAANLEAAFKPLKIATAEEDLSSHDIYIATIDGKIVAFVAFSDGELVLLYVDPSFQEQGVGSKLIEFSLTKTKRPTYLGVLTGNPVESSYSYKGFKFLKHESGEMPGNEILHVEVDLWIYKQEIDSSS